MNLTASEIELLKNAQSEQEWNKLCDRIKAVRGGQYPPDWWEKIMLSGLAGLVQSCW